MRVWFANFSTVFFIYTFLRGQSLFRVNKIKQVSWQVQIRLKENMLTVKGFSLAAITFYDSSWLLIHSTSPHSSLRLPQPSCTWKALSSRWKVLWAKWQFHLNWQEKCLLLKMAKNQFVIRYWTGFRAFLTLSDGHQSLSRIHFHYCSTTVIEPLNFKEKKQ